MLAFVSTESSFVHLLSISLPRNHCVTSARPATSTCAGSSRPQYSTNRCRPMKSGRLEQCLTRSCPDTGPHGANLAPVRRLLTFCVGGCSRRAGRQAGGSCGHHEQVNHKAERSLRGLVGPVGDTTFLSLSLAASSLFQPSRFVELASSAGYTDWQWLGDCF